MKSAVSVSLGISDHSQWTSAWRVFGADGDGTAILTELIDRYSAPYRAYHNLDHIRHCLINLSPVENLVTAWSEVVVAIWFHDAIYDPRRSDNEEQSARLAERQLRAAGVDADTTRRVADLIRFTTHTHDYLTGDEAVLCDIDLSILGAEPPLFDQYDAAIRQEYDWVPEEVYRRERGRVLARFLDRPHIYHSQFFFDRLEQQARANLIRVVRPCQS